MTNPDETLPVEQVDRDAAADFYGKHLSRPAEVSVTAHMRAGKIDESPLIQMLARHRRAAQSPPPVSEAKYISPDLAEVAGLVASMHTKWMQREDLMRQVGGFELMQRMADLMDGIVDAVPKLSQKLIATIAGAPNNGPPTVIRWEGTEDQQQEARMKACRERRAQHGEDDCEDKDGSCDECTYDMAMALRVPTASPSPGCDAETIEACAKVCEQQMQDFLSPEYATDQPLSSVQERIACKMCAAAIRNLGKEQG